MTNNLTSIVTYIGKRVQRGKELMQQPLAEADGKRFERTVSLGGFLVTVLALLLLNIGNYVNQRTQAALADERISTLTQAQARTDARVDSVQQQGNVINNSIGRIEGQMQNISYMLTHVNDKKP